VNLRVSGIGPITRPEIKRVSSGGFEAQAPGRLRTSTTESEDSVVELRGAPATSLETTRPVCFDAETGYVDTPVVPRTDLGPGASITGPVIVEEFGSTVPIHPGFEVRVDEYLNLIVTRVAEDEA
jgi:N-methylhydantoinase A